MATTVLDITTSNLHTAKKARNRAQGFHSTPTLSDSPRSPVAIFGRRWDKKISAKMICIRDSANGNLEISIPQSVADLSR
jgi:hypothetical protein